MQQEIDMWLKIVALVGAGAFFGWKLLTGWLFINLKVSIRLERAPKNMEEDHLAITVLLDKGSRDSIWLEHVSALHQGACKQAGPG